MIFTHPHTEGPGVWGHREEIHNGRRRWAKNMCEVEIYAEFAPPGEWTSKLELFLGEGGFFFGRFFGFRGSGYTESYLWHLVFTYTIKRWILHLHWWPIDRRTYFTEDHGDKGNLHSDAQELMQALGRGAIKGKWSALCENMVSNLLSVILQGFPFFGRILFSIFLAEDFQNMLWRYQADKKFDSLRGNIKEGDAKLFLREKKRYFPWKHNMIFINFGVSDHSNKTQKSAKWGRLRLWCFW